MSRKALIFLAVCLFVFCLAPFASAEIRWVSSYNEALSQAKSESKPIMADFYTEWCGWCKKLDSDTYKDSRIVSISQNFVCVKIDADKAPDIAQKYGISGYPTILFLDAKGNVIGGGPGYRDAGRLLSEMKAILSK